MAKSKKTKAKKSSITFEKNAFIAGLIFVVAAAMLFAYALMGYALIN